MKFLAFAGSSRENSFNKVIARTATEILAKTPNIIANFVDLANYSIPIYDADLEAKGLPGSVLELKQLLKQHQIFVIASPEYNGSYSGLLKNMFDWCSRPYQDEARLACFNEKLIIILTASPGNLGGIRGLAPLQNTLENMGSVVLPYKLIVPMVHQEINNNILSEGLKTNLTDILTKNLAFLKYIKNL